MSKNNGKYLVIILGVAIALRFIGIFHGFPYIFHPDEPTIIRSALGVRFYKNPGHFDWPHLYIYLNYFLYMAFAKLRDIIVALDFKEFVYFNAPIIFNDELIFYLLTRGFTAFLGALTVVPIYLTARDLFNEKTGLWAALALAVTPFHVWHSHYSLIDVPMMFFLTWSMFFSTKILFKKDLVNYLFAGIFLGFASSTKYNAALGVIFIVFAHILRNFFEKNERLVSYDSVEKLFFAGISTIFGFAVGTPYAVLDYSTFLIKDSAKGALWQFTNVGKVSFSQQISQFTDLVTRNVAENLGYTLMYVFLLAVLFIIYDLIKHRKNFTHRELLFFVLTGLFLLFYVSGSEKTRAHYFFIAYQLALFILSY
jgi:4-amino-4-deoxy-L-arabinose transferase-like glycosyltransferase